MIDIVALQSRIVQGLQEHMNEYGVTAIIERDQQAPKPPYPFIGLKWTSIVPQDGKPDRTRSVVASDDPEWAYDVEYRYVENPEPVLSVSAYDGDGTLIHTLSQAAHQWFRIPELAGDWLEPLDTSIVSVGAITDRDTVLDREVERRQGFDVRLRVVDIVRVTVPTIERVEIDGMDGEIVQDIDL